MARLTPPRGGSRRLRPETKKVIQNIFQRLDYTRLAPIYCDEGGDLFWAAHRESCQRIGIRLAETLLHRLSLHGRSLYVGAGVAELPMLAMETLELNRAVEAYNLRADEVAVLNEACRDVPFGMIAADAAHATGPFDHVWIVSVLNDPEWFPHLSALSYGRADPLLFDGEAFERERQRVRSLTEACLRQLRPPSLVTTSVEELAWIEEWCRRHRRRYEVQPTRPATALVKDPVCFVAWPD